MVQVKTNKTYEVDVPIESLEEQNISERSESSSRLKKFFIIITSPFILVIGVLAGFFYSIYAIGSWLLGKKTQRDDVELIEKKVQHVPEQTVDHSKSTGHSKSQLTKVDVETIADRFLGVANYVQKIHKFESCNSYLVEQTRSVINHHAYEKVMQVNLWLELYRSRVVASITIPLSVDVLLESTNEFLKEIKDHSVKHAVAGVLNGFLRKVVNPEGKNVYDVVVSLDEKEGYFKFANMLLTNPVKLLPETQIAGLPALLFEVMPIKAKDFKLIKSSKSIEGIRHTVASGVPFLFGNLFPRASVEETTNGSVIALGKEGKFGAGIVDFTADVVPFHNAADNQEVFTVGREHHISHGDSNSGIVEGNGCNEAYVAITDGLARLAMHKADVIKANAMTDFYNTLFHGRQTKNAIVAEVLAAYLKMDNPNDKDIRQAFVGTIKQHAATLGKDAKYIIQMLDSERFYNDGYKAVCSEIMIPIIVARARGKLGSDVKQWSISEEFKFVESIDPIEQHVSLQRAL